MYVSSIAARQFRFAKAAKRRKIDKNVWPAFELFCDANVRFQERINSTLVFEHIAKVMAVTHTCDYSSVSEKNTVGKSDLLVQFMAVALPTIDGAEWVV